MIPFETRKGDVQKNGEGSNPTEGTKEDGCIDFVWGLSKVTETNLKSEDDK